MTSSFDFAQDESLLGHIKSIFCAPLAASEYIPIYSPMNPNPHASPLQRLAAKWRMFGLIAVAFVQLLRRYEDGRRAGARAHAEQLYVIVRTAQVMLVKDVAEAMAAEPPQTDGNRNALARLHLIAVCLLALSFIIENILARGLARASNWMQTRTAFSASFGSVLTMVFAGDIPLLDPG